MIFCNLVIFFIDTPLVLTYHRKLIIENLFDTLLVIEGQNTKFIHTNTLILFKKKLVPLFCIGDLLIR